MAESIKNYECGICLNLIVEPTVLPCQHLFCIMCIREMGEFNQQKCPLCRQCYSHQVLVINQNLNSYIQQTFPQEFQIRFQEVEEIKKLEANKALITFGYGNNHQLVENPKKSVSSQNSNKHNWTVFVKCITEGFKTEDFVDKVKYELHETFHQPIQWTTKKDKFQLSCTGWGYFTIPIEIHFKKESGLGCKMVNHTLNFTRNQTQAEFTIKADISFIQKKTENVTVERKKK